MAIDIESCTELNPNIESESSKKAVNGLRSTGDGMVVDESGFMNHGDKVATENTQLVIDINPKVDGVVVGRDLVEKEKRKTLSAKKPPKPPRPPREFPLDAADKKLVKEIAELALIKRARAERRKALKKSRAAKASNSSSSSSGGSYLAMLLTFVFCLVLVCHGFSSKIKPPANLGDTLFSSGVGSDSRYILVEDHMALSSSTDSSSSPSGSSNLVEPALNLDDQNMTKGATS